MDHERIEAQNVIERYVMGRLAPEEEALFEEHLLECRDCRQSIEQEEDFQSSLHALAAGEAARATAAVQVSALAWLARRRWLWAAAVLLLLGLPAVWLLREQARLRTEIAHLQAAAERRPRPAPATPGPVSPRSNDAEQRRLAEGLRAEKAAREELSERLARLTQPRVNTPIFSLGFLRGEDETANRVELGRQPEWIVLSVELPAEEAPSYRATLLKAGKTVWSGGELLPMADGTVRITLYSPLLEPGRYQLRLQAVDAHGHDSAVGEIPFQVSRSPGP
jgi:putative zinc finger protein